jgi:hypothetical protein
MLEEIAAPEVRYSRFKVVCVEGFTRDNLPCEHVTLSRGGRELITRSLEVVGELAAEDYLPPARWERLPTPLTKAELEELVVSATVPLARIVFFGTWRDALKGASWSDASGGTPHVELFSIPLEDASPEEDAEAEDGEEPEGE